VFVKVRLHHVVTGVDIDRKAVADAIRLSEEKYCSVGAMLHKSAEFDTTFEIREVAAAAAEEDHSRVAEGVVG
jgi:putative redox protein